MGNIIHPTDFSHGSDVAFAHALRLAVAAQGELEILHVDPADARSPDWESFPSVRDTLAQWELIDAGAAKAEVARLGVQIAKTSCKSHQTAKTVLARIDQRGAELVVLATHQREGLARLMHSSVSGSISSRTEAASLLVPYGTEGFVDTQSGQVTLNRILLPLTRKPDPQPAVELVAQLVTVLASGPVEIHLLHIGDPADMPALTFPVAEDCKWIWETRVGDVTEGICDYAEEQSVDLIAMTTKGHDGFLDMLRGSKTERVLNRASCPVLSVHAADS